MNLFQTVAVVVINLTTLVVLMSSPSFPMALGYLITCAWTMFFHWTNNHSLKVIKSIENKITTLAGTISEYNEQNIDRLITARSVIESQQTEIKTDIDILKSEMTSIKMALRH